MRVCACVEGGVVFVEEGGESSCVCSCACMYVCGRVDVWMGVGPCEERRERKMLYVNEEVMKPQLNMSLDTCALKTSRCCTSSNICFTTPPNDASSPPAGKEGGKEGRREGGRGEGREREVSTQVFGFQLLQPMIVKV